MTNPDREGVMAKVARLIIDIANADKAIRLISGEAVMKLSAALDAAEAGKDEVT